MNPGEIAGSIHTDKKPKKVRRKLTLKNRVDELEQKIIKADQRAQALRMKRDAIVEEARRALQEVDPSDALRR